MVVREEEEELEEQKKLEMGRERSRRGRRYK